ncbi:MAG: sulfotransferase, partial [Desulfobacteraceae bacterium]|nr:sulfotransferase [Desulfobacteraceae bacterium]
HSEQIAAAVGATSGKEVIVDSSKEITRALFLMRFVPGSRVVHLVRHPEKVLQSNFYRLEKGSGFKFLRMRFTPRRWFGPFLFASAAAWMIGNIMAEVVRLFGRDRFLRIRYEDLIASPLEQLDRIEKFAGVSLAEVKRRVREKQPFNVGHNIGGNHMRMAGSFVLDPKKASRQGLPKRYSLMVQALCWPLLWKYGYFYDGKKKGYQERE